MEDNKDQPKAKRPRISEQQKAITDPAEYGPNGGSLNARKFHTLVNDHRFELWIDKHCTIRQAERAGIGFDEITALVVSAINHLFYYQFRYPPFRFIQFHPEFKGVDKRIIIQTPSESGPLLNVVVAFFLIDINIYEVTFITAMVTDGWRTGDGQHVLFVDGERSILSRKLDVGMVEIAKIE